MRGFRHMAAAGAILGATVAAFAQTEIKKTDTVVSGQPKRVAIHINVRPDCSSGPLVGVKITKMPEHGSLVLRRGVMRSKRYRNCDNLVTPAQALFYQSRPGYAGTDAFTYSVTRENGETVQVTFSLTVMAAGSKPPAPRKDEEGIEL